MMNLISSLALAPAANVEAAWEDVQTSFERFCLAAGVAAMEAILREDAKALAGARHGWGGARTGQRCGMSQGKLGFHGSKVRVKRPLVDNYDGHEMALPAWTAAQTEDWDGAKALSQAIRRTFGAGTPIQRCQIHKACNIIERLPKTLHASVRKTLRHAWELDDAENAERLLHNVARRLDELDPSAVQSLREGLNEMLTVIRLSLP